jgi:acyl carrier protein
MRDAIETKVKKVLKENLELDMEIEKIGIEEDLVVKGMNSIKFLKVIVALEEAFDIDIDEDEFNIENFRTIKNLISTIEKLS